MVARSGPFGQIALGAPARALAPEDVALVEEIGRRAGTAIENARLYRQAQDAIAVREQFLAVASHELKTPLTALLLVIGGVERSLTRLPAAPPAMLRKIDVLARQARRLDQLVTSLLDVARIEAGRLHVVLEDVDLCAVVREVAERHEQDAALAGCTLEIVADEPITGTWDHSRVDQVVSNLLSNAIKYGAGKPVSVVVEARGEAAHVSVTDRGIGLAPADHERVFQRFERAATKGFSGIGLGLWITREIVTRLGGSIRVQSQLGEGARFSVELPLRAAPEPRPPPAP
jgi:signal transduction histidine kinase